MWTCWHIYGYVPTLKPWHHAVSKDLRGLVLYSQPCEINFFTIKYTYFMMKVIRRLYDIKKEVLKTEN